MATNRKVVSKLKTNKVVIKPIENIPTKKVEYPLYSDGNYNIDGDTNDLVDLVKNIVEDTSEGIEINIKHFAKDNKILSFEEGETEYCCGIIQLGDLKCSIGVTPGEIKAILDTYIQCNKGLTFMINTNGNEISKRFDAGLAISERFILVKTFKNRNSNNIIKMWISNND